MTGNGTCILYTAQAVAKFTQSFYNHAVSKFCLFFTITKAQILAIQCIVRILTRRRGEEIEEGVILNSFCNSSNRSSRLMLLLLLNCLYSDILALFPINDATLKSNTYHIKRSSFPSKLDWPIIQTGIHFKTGMGNYCG